MTDDRHPDPGLLRAFRRVGSGAHLAPDYTDAVLARTAAVRQRPAWAIRERWFPMTVVTEHVAGPRLPWRVVALAAMAILGVAIGGVLVAGSRDPRIPAPFGPAHNGSLVFDFWRIGDLYLGDASGGAMRPLTSGPDFDTTPSFSRDGASLVFVRSSSPDPSAQARLMISKADGSDIRPLTDPTLTGISDLDWSGDGRWIAVTSVIGGVPSLSIVDVASGSSHVLDVGMAVSDASFRPPMKDELLFVGEAAGVQGLYVVHADGSERRELLRSSVGLMRPVWSPDGSQIAYTLGRLGTPPVPSAAHVVAADGTGDRTLPRPPDVLFQVYPVWSPDGHSLVIGRYPQLPETPATGFHLTIVSVDGKRQDVDSPPLSWPHRGREIVWDWAPTGDTILISTPEGGVNLDVATFAQTNLVGWFDPAWQRAARD